MYQHVWMYSIIKITCWCTAKTVTTLVKIVLVLIKINVPIAAKITYADPLRIVFPILVLVHAQQALLILMVNASNVALWTLQESVGTFVIPVALTIHFLIWNLIVLCLLRNVHNMMVHLQLTVHSQCIIWNSSLVLVMVKVSLFKARPTSLTSQMN